MGAKGFISITHVIHHINRQRKAAGLTTVPNPSAQTLDLCSGHSSHQPLEILISSAMEHWQKDHPLMYHFAMLQAETGARVSELLQIHSRHITENGRINLDTKKGGNTRILEPITNRQWYISERSKSRYLFQDLNRFQIHREYVKHGIAAHFGKNIKRSTTHLFRHLVGLDLSTLANPTHSIKTALGQKTESAATYYQAKIRGKKHS